MSERILPGFLNIVSSDGLAVQKRFKEEGLVKIPPARRYRAELNAQLRYKDNPTVMLPNVYEANSDALTISMEKISGKRLVDALKEANNEEKESIARQTGAVLRAIHMPAQVKASPDVYLQHFFQQTESKLRKNSERIHQIGLQPDDIMNKMHELINKEEATKDGVVFVHRDYSIRNIICDPADKKMRVIDWEESGIGLSYEDSLIAVRLEEQFPETISAFWDGYGKTPDRPTMLGYTLGIFSQLYANADVEYLQSMSNIAGIDIQESFANSIKNLIEI